VRRPSPLASLGFAALLGAGLGAGTLAVLPAVLPTSGPSVQDAEAADAMLTQVATRGFVDGRWRIVEQMWTRERLIARDPARADLCQVRLLDRAGAPVLPAACDDLTRHLLGDVAQFLQAYPLTAGPVVEGEGDARAVSFEWTREGGPSRRAWFRASTGDLLRLVERDGAGELLRSIELVERGLAGWTPTPVPPRAVVRGARASDAEPDFAAFAARVPVPIYEPARLPPKFRRADYGFDDRAPRGDTSGEKLPLAWVVYTDGLVRMNLFVARRADMRRLEALAREQTTVAGRTTCPTSSAQTPEEMLEGADAILVHRRDDGCRVVLRRDDLPDVAVALVGYRGLAADDYVQTIRTLVRVSPTKPGEVPLHEPDGR